jgi:DNA primase
MKIAPETVDRVRSATDIVTLVGEHVRLSKSGKSFKGLCPFHTEKTPSFMVNAEKQTYHCFGCGAGGNAITFLMEYAKMSFPEAVRYLGERAGIEILAAGDEARESETGRLYEALASAAAFFRARLQHPSGGRPAREYLDRRGIDLTLAEDFGLGFAPAGWSHLLDEAGRRFTPEVLTRAGLTIAREGGGHYDRFRNRLMIPVLNHMGKVVGFGGRSIDPEDEPKYLKSPESPVYQKGQILFGLPQARDAMHREDQALLVEGYLDHFRVFGAGFRNVVAVAGTAFTSHQAALLKRFARRAVFVFDGDQAGITASWRAVAPCLAAGLDVRLALLPPGHDPDSLIRDQGVDAFRSVLSGSMDLVEFAATRIVPERGREEALHRLVEVIRECPDPIRRRLLIQAAAERLRFDEATLVRAIESGKNAGAPVAGMTENARPAAEAPAEPVERGLLALILANPESFDLMEGLKLEDFREPICREIYRLLGEDSDRKTWADRLMEEDPASRTARLVSQLRVDSAGGGEQAILDHFRRLVSRRLERRHESLKEELRIAEAIMDESRSLSIRVELNQIRNEIKNLASLDRPRSSASH